MEDYEVVRPVYDAVTRKEYWNTAIGLQRVDDLQPSEYLKSLAQKHTENKLTNREIESLLYEYYESRQNETSPDRTKECDIVSNRIEELLENPEQRFSPVSLKSIHKYLFHDIYDNAGQYRTFNISKKEPVLNGETVKYSNFFDIEEYLEYDFSEEKKYISDYADPILRIKRITRFTSSIWQVHPFSEGNTRTTAVFLERYLISMGFPVNNEMFQQHSLYFRNALVRSNFADYSRGITPTDLFLKWFFENLLLNERHPLNNRELYVNVNDKEQPIQE